MSDSQYTYKRQELMKDKSKTKMNNKNTWKHITAEEFVNVTVKLLEFLHRIVLFPGDSQAGGLTPLIDLLVDFEKIAVMGPEMRLRLINSAACAPHKS
jgi:hypothetical protein